MLTNYNVCLEVEICITSYVFIFIQLAFYLQLLAEKTSIGNIIAKFLFLLPKLRDSKVWKNRASQTNFIKHNVIMA